jgi:hypothetical protein
MSNNLLPLDAAATSLAAAQANVLASTTAQVALLNNNLKTIYLSAFNDWTINLLAGRPAGDPPKPPKAYRVVTGADGFAYPQLGDALVCDMPPVPEAPPPYVAPVLPEPENIRSVPVGDKLPVGFVMVDAGGIRWQKQASPTPFGVAYFYAKVA